MFVDGNGSEYILALTTGKNEGYIHIGTITGKSLCDLEAQETCVYTFSPRALVPCHVSSGEVAGSGLFHVNGHGYVLVQIQLEQC